MPTNVKNREMDGTFPYLHCKQSTTLPLNQNFVFFLTQNINIHMLFKCNIYVNSCIRFDKHEKDRSMELNMLLKETPAIMMFLSNTVNITGKFAFTLLGFFKTLYKSRHYCE